jgi:hypothetical protein
MDHLLHELPDGTDQAEHRGDMESSHPCSERYAPNHADDTSDDETPLLQRRESQPGHLYKPPPQEATSSSTTHRAGSDISDLEKEDDPTKPLAGLNALEIAAVANAKKFLGQRLVQKVVQDIWDGNIIFWESLSVNAVKKARVYNKRYWLGSCSNRL